MIANIVNQNNEHPNEIKHKSIIVATTYLFCLEKSLKYLLKKHSTFPILE